MNMSVWIPLQDLDFSTFRQILRRRIVGSYGSPSLNFLKTFILFSFVSIPFCIPAIMCKCSKYSASSSAFVIVYILIIFILTGVKWYFTVVFMWSSLIINDGLLAICIYSLEIYLFKALAHILIVLRWLTSIFYFNSK